MSDFALGVLLGSLVGANVGACMGVLVFSLVRMAKGRDPE